MQNRLILSLLFLLTLIAFVFLPFATFKAFPPIAANDRLETSKDTPLTISHLELLENDVAGSAELDPSTIVISKSSSSLPSTNYGEIQTTGNKITYSPKEGFIGEENFEYQICDVYGLCTRAQINLKVTEKKSPSGIGTPRIEILETMADCDLESFGTTASTSCTAPEEELVGYIYGHNAILGANLPNNNSYQHWLLMATAVSLALGFLMSLARQYTFAFIDSLVAGGLLIGFYLALTNKWLKQPNGWFDVSLEYGFWVVLSLAVFCMLCTLVVANYNDPKASQKSKPITGPESTS